MMYPNKCLGQWYTVLVVLFIINVQSIAQIDFNDKKVLNQYFTDYEIIERKITTEHIENYRNQGLMDFEFKLKGKSINFDCHSSATFSETLMLSDSKSRRPQSEQERPIVLRGHTSQYKDIISMTLNTGFMYGTIQQDDQLYFVEPLRYYIKDASDDLYICYKSSDPILQNIPNACAVKAQQRAKHDVHDHIHEQRSMGDCFEVEFAIAADFSMVQEFGSVTAVENHLTGVFNNVQANYDNEFADELSFIINEFFISSCASCDPWTSSTDAGTLLGSFRSWGQAGGFFGNYDIASIWTDRDFDGTTVGIASVGVVCTGFRYNANQNFTGNANLIRQVWSHELGHNWDSFHDASGSSFIMAPSVNGSNTWSSTSINDIQNHYLSRSCLASCVSSAPPTASFTFNASNACAPATVSFSNTSSGATSYSWSFPGGSPSTSTDPNPSVVYANAGVYSVELTATNAAGSNTDVQSNVITIAEQPIAAFDSNISGTVGTFISTSSGTDLSYIWSFPDGSVVTTPNANYDFLTDGIYSVRLQVSNACGISNSSFDIEIVTPTIPDFTVDATMICRNENVSFTNLSSSNTNSVFWEFEGANPVTSTENSPIVNYPTPGTYDVQLSAINSLGSNELFKQDYIEVLQFPFPEFTYSVDGLTVTFTNVSSNTSEYFWDFGDGSTSILENPSHTYETTGTYNVTLNGSNAACSPLSFSEEIDIVLAPFPNFTASMTAICALEIVIFNDVSTNNPSSWSWTFEGGNPSTSQEQNPAISYSNPGTYSVTLEATNADGSNSITIDNFITVGQAPESNFSDAVDGLNVNLTNLSTAGDMYTWDFGDGNFSTLENPSHIYTTQGTYEVQLTVSNPCGTDTYTTVVDAYLSPESSFTTIGQACVGDTPLFSSTSNNASTLTWIFEGATMENLTGENVAPEYLSAGVYDITLIASNPIGSDTMFIADAIEIFDYPSSEFTFQVNGLNVDLQVTNPVGANYFWNFGDGGSDGGTSVSNSYSSQGVYDVTLETSNFCGTESTTIPITLFNTVEASIASDVNIACPGGSISFLSNSSNVESYQWSFQGGSPATSDLQNPIIDYNIPGSFDVTLIVSNALFSDTLILEDYVVIQTLPDAQATIQSNQLDFVFDASNSTGDSYLWDFGDGNSSTDALSDHSYMAEGYYDVTLSVTNACGTDTYSETLLAAFPATAAFEVDNQEICVGDEVIFNNMSSANAVTYSWLFVGADTEESAEKNPIIKYSDAGTYDVVLIVESFNSADTLVLENYITVIDIPSAAFTEITSGSTVAFTNISTNTSDYSWDFGDGNFSTEENPTHNYDAAGTYEVMLIVKNECGESAFIREIMIAPSSIDDIDEISSAFIYPNPVIDGNVNVSISSNAVLDIDLEVYNDLGQVISRAKTMKMIEGKNNFHLDLSDVSSGIYFLKISSESGYIVEKIHVLR